MAIRRGKYVQHDAAGAICAICRKRRNTTRSIQRHVKQVHGTLRPYVRPGGRIPRDL